MPTRTCTECGASFGASVASHRTKCAKCSKRAAARRYATGGATRRTVHNAPKPDEAPEEAERRYESSQGAPGGFEESPVAPKGPSAGPLKAKLTGMIASLGTTVWTMGQARQSPAVVYDGTVIIARAEDLGAALDALAKENPRVRKALEAMVATSAWADVAMVSVSIVLPMLAAHGILPAETATMVGAPEPPPRPDPAPEVITPNGADPASSDVGFHTPVDGSL